MGKKNNLITLSVAEGYEANIRIMYHGISYNHLKVPVGTELKIVFTGTDYDLPMQVNNEGITPYAWESENYRYFKPGSESAIKLYAWGFSYDICEIDYVAEKTGSFYTYSQ